MNRQLLRHVSKCALPQKLPEWPRLAFTNFVSPLSTHIHGHYLHGTHFSMTDGPTVRWQECCRGRWSKLFSWDAAAKRDQTATRKELVRSFVPPWSPHGWRAWGLHRTISRTATFSATANANAPVGRLRLSLVLLLPAHCPPRMIPVTTRTRWSTRYMVGVNLTEKKKKD